MMRAWIVRRPVLAFYVLTLLFSWGYWFALLMQGLKVEQGGATSHFPGLLGPLLAAMSITAITDGFEGLREFWRRMLPRGPRWRSGLVWALSPLLLGAIAFGALHMIGRPVPALPDFTEFAGVPHYWSPIVVLMAVIVANGFGEEAGWRGFLTERLLDRHDRFTTTILVTVLWAIWHIPLFWLNANMAALVGPVLIGWLIGLLCGAFVLAYVYLAGGHNIFWVAVWHAAYNFMVATTAGKGLPAAIVTTLVMIGGAAVALAWWRGRRSGAHQRR